MLSRSRYDLFVDGNIHLCTVATDEKKAHKLKQSAIKQNANLINLGEGVVWEGGDMKGQGGGHKINLVKEYIKDKRDTDIFIFLDGYDTFLSDSITEIVSRYIAWNTDILFSSERFCWPDERIGTLLKELNTNQSHTLSILELRMLYWKNWKTEGVILQNH